MMTHVGLPCLAQTSAILHCGRVYARAGADARVVVGSNELANLDVGTELWCSRVDCSRGKCVPRMRPSLCESCKPSEYCFAGLTRPPCTIACLMRASALQALPRPKLCASARARRVKLMPQVRTSARPSSQSACTLVPECRCRGLTHSSSTRQYRPQACGPSSDPSQASSPG